MKKLSICILGFNKFNFTSSCLKDLSHLNSDHEILFWDNASTDQTQSQLENSKEIKYYRSDVNLKFAGGCNQLYKLSTAPNVLFLNNDIVIRDNKENWTNQIIQYCEQDFIVGPTMGELNPDLSFKREANEFINSKYSYMSGWCLGSSKTTFDKLKENYDGPFSEEFGFYFEDTDLGFRAKRKNINFKIVNIPVIHFGKQSSSQLNTGKLYTEAKKIFIKKWKNKI
jgi:GT2 family glycosyltransferase